MEKIKVLVLTSAGAIPAEVNNDIDVLQKAVGGPVEVYMYSVEGFAVLCNENGRMQGSTPTCKVKSGMLAGTVLVGTVLLVGLTRALDDFCDIPQFLADNWTEYFTIVEE